MLLWQLSTPTNVTGVKKKRRKKRSKQVHYDKESAEDEQEIDSDEEQVNVKGAVADIYLNSDGEEEVYYSAPESPLASEDSGASVDLISTAILCSSQQPQIVKERHSKKTKRKMKMKCYLAKAAQVEFFQPLYDLEKIQVEMNQLKVFSCAQVLSLTEICMRKIRAYSPNLGMMKCYPFALLFLLLNEL